MESLENSLAILQTGKHRITMGPSNFTPRYTPKRNANICPHKSLYPNLQSSIIHNRQKMKTA